MWSRVKKWIINQCNLRLLKEKPVIFVYLCQQIAKFNRKYHIAQGIQNSFQKHFDDKHILQSSQIYRTQLGERVTHWLKKGKSGSNSNERGCERNLFVFKWEFDGSINEKLVG